MVRTGHTCIPYIVKSKKGFMEKQVIQSRSRCACMWISGWVDDGMTYSSECWLPLSFIIPLFLFSFFQTWLSLFIFSSSPFLFFGPCFFGMPSFLFWGNHSLITFLFQGYYRERVCHHIEHLLVDGGGANSQCTNVASGCGCVRDLYRESIKRFSLKSQNLTELNRMTSSICVRFLMV